MQQLIVLLIIVASMAAFIAGRWRHDAIAICVLLTLVLSGIVPASEAFAGFGHPAVVTVGAVLVITRALTNSGVVETVARLLARLGDNASVQLIALTLVVTLCSAVMNNVGALAILLPIALQVARRCGEPPSSFLMPLAFGSLLGGLMTSFGTPANLIVANHRTQVVGTPFALFDYFPVGAGVALAGLAVIWLLGRRVLPHREAPADGAARFEIDEYLTELRLPDDSKFADRNVAALEDAGGGDVVVVAIVRGDRRHAAPVRREILRPGDGVVVEADAEALKAFIDATGLALPTDGERTSREIEGDDAAVAEAVIAPGSRLIGSTAREIRLRDRYGLTLLGLSRQGAGLGARPSRVAFRAGDVLLVQADRTALHEQLARLDCLPLAARDLRIGSPRRILTALGLFGAAIVAIVAGWLPVQIALVAAALAMLAARLIDGREVYASIDFSILVLLAGFIPLGVALETTGAAQRVAESLLGLGAWFSPPAILFVLLVVTMSLSDVVNNAAAAALMAPIGATLAAGLGASPDPFLMVVALGASASFLTPIGHQSNTLVMGPGGYAFGDYWKLGLPLSVVYAAVGLTLVLFVWPLHTA